MERIHERAGVGHARELPELHRVRVDEIHLRLVHQDVQVVEVPDGDVRSMHRVHHRVQIAQERDGGVGRDVLPEVPLAVAHEDFGRREEGHREADDLAVLVRGERLRHDDRGREGPEQLDERRELDLVLLDATHSRGLARRIEREVGVIDLLEQLQHRAVTEVEDVGLAALADGLGVVPAHSLAVDGRLSHDAAAQPRPWCHPSSLPGAYGRSLRSRARGVAGACPGS